jgi:hypothetical protein
MGTNTLLCGHSVLYYSCHGHAHVGTATAGLCRESLRRHSHLRDANVVALGYNSGHIVGMGMCCVVGVMLHGGRSQLVVWMVRVASPHSCLVRMCHGHLVLQMDLQLLLLGAGTRLLVVLLLLLQRMLLVSLTMLHGR